MKYEVQKIKISDIFADPSFNCRGIIAPVDVMDLARDIKKHGLLTPITVSPYTEKEGKLYRVVAGHRRLKAFLVNEEKNIPAFIRDDLSELDARILNLNENIARQELTLYQEAMAIKALFDLGMSEGKVMKAIGATRGWVQIRFMLLKLPTEVQEDAKEGTISHQTVRDAYSVQVNGGSKEEIFEVIKTYKDAKAKGIPVIRNQKAKAPAKRVRQPAEIFKLQDIVRKTFGNGLTTRCLAWCGGAINNKEMLEALQETAETQGTELPLEHFLQ